MHLSPTSKLGYLSFKDVDKTDRNFFLLQYLLCSYCKRPLTRENVLKGKYYLFVIILTQPE